MLGRIKRSWSKERRGMTEDPAAHRDSESGSVPQTQDLFEVGGETQAAA